MELTGEGARALLPARDERGAKWAFGRALLCCGSRNMPGAAVLSTRAALRAGTGLTVLAAVPTVLAAVTHCAPSCVQCPLPEGADGTVSAQGLPVLLGECARSTAVLCGCGLGRSDDARAVVRALIERVEHTLVLDADALNLLAEEPGVLKRAACAVVLTPHARELARLCGDGTTPERFAKKYGVTLLRKGSTSAVITEKGVRWTLDAPNSGMAKGGSGDVLAGLTVGLAAQGCAPAEAAALALYLHARAGARARDKYGARAMLPDDVIDALGDAFSELE